MLQSNQSAFGLNPERAFYFRLILGASFKLNAKKLFFLQVPKLSLPKTLQAQWKGVLFLQAHLQFNRRPFRLNTESPIFFGLTFSPTKGPSSPNLGLWQCAFFSLFRSNLTLTHPNRMHIDG